MLKYVKTSVMMFLTFIVNPHFDQLESLKQNHTGWQDTDTKFSTLLDDPANVAKERAMVSDKLLRTFFEKVMSSRFDSSFRGCGDKNSIHIPGKMQNLTIVSLQFHFSAYSISFHVFFFLFTCKKSRP